MPAPWLLVHAASLIAMQGQAAKPSVMQLPGNVKITYESGAYDIEKDTWTFDQGVVIALDVTTVKADHLVVDLKQEHGSASGHVHLDDPVAQVDAQNLEVWWNPKSRHGHVENAFVQLGSSRVRAKSIDIEPTLWTMHDVELTTSRANPPWYELHTPLMTVKPGQSGKMKKPVLYLLGHRIVTLPDRSFNLDQRSEGLTVPGLNYNRQNGLGVSWGGGFLLNHSTDMAFGIGIFPDSRPGYGASISHSFLPDSKPTTLITPASDFSERFSYSFMDDVAVISPEGEDRVVRSPRRTLSIDTVWNQQLTDRGTSAPFSKPVESVYELGGEMKGFGYIGQARLQTIREFGDPITTRVELVGDLAAPPIKLAPNLRTMIRVDSEIFADHTQYGWVRGSVGLAYMPIPQIRLSVGPYFSTDAGKPEFPIDTLYSHSGYSVRADFISGTTKISFLRKYDPSLGWFDKEYSISQVVGCFEPFILYRKNPSDYQLGLRLRLDSLTDLMTKRNFKRTDLVPKVISPGPDGKP